MLAQPPIQSVQRPIVRDLQGTLRGPIQKLMIQLKNGLFRSNSLCITYLFLLQEEQNDIQKFDTGTSTGRLWNQVTGRSGDQIMGCSRHVRWTLVKYVFFKSTEKHIKLTLAGFSRLYYEW